jgi:Insertion element 4 transposase N-terminal
MGYSLHSISPNSSLVHELCLDALQKVIPTKTIELALSESGLHTKRKRKLTLITTVLLVILMTIYTQRSLSHVLEKLLQGLRFIWPTDTLTAPSAAAFSYRRYQLGARPLARLFHLICHPFASPDTKGAFLFGLRLLAIDGTGINVPDTPENAAAFGYPITRFGVGAFPLVQALYLIECGTHAIVDVGFWPWYHSERRGAYRLLRSIGPGMLLLWDRGFHDAALLDAVVKRGAQVLGRLPAHVKPHRVRSLPDGSYLARLPLPPTAQRQTRSLLVRVIVSTFSDPARPGFGETHRLITTLRSHTAAPALELVCAYHERL